MFIVLHEELGLWWGDQVTMLQSGGIIIKWKILYTFTDDVMIWSTLGKDLLFIHFVNIFGLLLKNNDRMGKMSLVLICGTSKIFFFLLTWMIEAVFYDYKFWLGFLTMQEESNPLWFNNFLPHFGTTTNTCTEVPPPPTIRMSDGRAAVMSLCRSLQNFPSLECMTVKTFSPPPKRMIIW